MSKTRVVETDPEFRRAPWRPWPTKWDQALEAARDDPTRRELVNMLCSLDLFADVYHDDDPYAPTTITVTFADGQSGHVGNVITICERAGWRVHNVTWGRRRLAFRRRGEDRE